MPAAKRVAPVKVVEKLIALGLVLYAGTGFLTMLLPLSQGGESAQANFLNYETLNHSLNHEYLPGGQHLGIFLVELGVGITVTSVMIMIFYAFAGREPVDQKTRKEPLGS